MNEEIVVEDVDTSFNIDRQLSIEEQQQQPQQQGAHVMPLLYIQQNNIRSAQSPTNQSLLPNNQTQLTTLLNPMASSMTASSNKVFIQSPNPVVNIPQAKQQHIVIRHPITSVNATPSQSSGQKHILLRKPNSTNAQIVPLNTTSPVNPQQSSSGKHAFAYLGCTLIKPNKTRESVVIPTGAISTTPMQKPKIVIAPMISGPGMPTCSTPVTQSQPQKHMANLILPVSISQPAGSTNQSMLNLHFNNGHLNTDSKGTITVLRESKSSNESCTNPPPLHPITKISLLNVNTNGSNSSDSIKITENPDSAVITPIPTKKPSPSAPPKRMKTISNILRGSAEKRPKKQTFPKTTDNSDMSCSVSSPESEQEKSKKPSTDDDITLIKVVQSEDKSRQKSSSDDDVKIEIIKTLTSENGEIKQEKKNDIKTDEVKELVNGNHTDSDCDASKALEWKDGVGALPGSTLKFRINEFGLMEVVDEGEHKQDKRNSGDKENVCLSRNSAKSNSSGNDKKPEDKKACQPVNADTLYCCESCGCYGMAAEFDSPVSCSPACTEMLAVTKQMALRREKEARDLRAKRKRKKLMLQEQIVKVIPEKIPKIEEKEKIIEKDKEKDKEREKDKIKEKEKEKIPKEEQKIESDEESRGTSIANMDEESQNEKIESKYPWQTGKHGFSWSKYLEYCKAKAAPVKLFKEAFPYGKNLFKVGMKLEGIDPEHPSRYCVLSVFEVAGYRIRLHFDGYPENFDFWVNADSMDIFPVGWSEKNGHKLDPPKGYVASNFNWNAYLKTCKATPAPKTAFSSKSAVFPPTGFRIGMKLEAVDRKHSSLVCVASISGLMDSRILVHFDSWDEVYDYWADASSPYIHPVGWCHHNGYSLTPPNHYKEAKSFTWDAYLRENQSAAAPARAFKQRPPCGFKRGMKFEAVDKRVPQLIRVTTVEDVKDHMIKIRFDGWPESHAYWVDDDSPDIHPVGWCNKTGHPLEPPLTPEATVEKAECGTPGCRGTGHIKGPKFATHNSLSGCPYSLQNLHKFRMNTDRLNVKHEICDYEEDSIENRTKSTDRYEWRLRDKSDKSDKYEQKNIKADKDVKLEDEQINKQAMSESRSSKIKHHQSDGNTDEEEQTTRKRKKRRQVSEESNSAAMSNSTGCGESPTTYAPNIPDKQLRYELYQSVYDPGYSPMPDAPHIWAKHSNALNRTVAKQNTNPRRWSNEEVIKFIQTVPNCKEASNIFRKNSVDGEAFLMLTQEDLISALGLHLGPAIKLYNSIVLLRSRVM